MWFYYFLGACTHRDLLAGQGGLTEQISTVTSKITWLCISIIYPTLRGVSNHWIGINTGMEWIGTIRNSEIMKFTFSFIVVLH